MTPIAELTARYGISRPTLYSWFKLLAVQREKDGNKTLINDKDSKRLDQLHEYLKDGGKLSEYLEPVEALPVHEPKPVMQTPERCSADGPTGYPRLTATDERVPRAQFATGCLP